MGGQSRSSPGGMSGRVHALYLCVDEGCLATPSADPALDFATGGHHLSPARAGERRSLGVFGVADEVVNTTVLLAQGGCQFDVVVYDARHHRVGLLQNQRLPGGNVRASEIVGPHHEWSIGEPVFREPRERGAPYRFGSSGEVAEHGKHLRGERGNPRYGIVERRHVVVVFRVERLLVETGNHLHLRERCFDEHWNTRDMHMLFCETDWVEVGAPQLVEAMPDPGRRAVCDGFVDVEDNASALRLSHIPYECFAVQSALQCVCKRDFLVQNDSGI